MKPGFIFFYSASFFLIGVFLTSVLQEWPSRFWIVVGIALLVSLFCLARGLARKATAESRAMAEGFSLESRWAAICSLVIILGAGYAIVFDIYRLDSNLPIGQKTTLTGFVEKAEQGAEGQELIVSAREAYNGKLKIFSQKYPGYKYGDILNIDGKIEQIQDEYKNHYLKDGITARMRNSKITPTGENEGFWLKRELFAARDFVAASFQKSLSPEKASFMSGLILGDTSGFTKEFREKLSLTGTSHLVALSGYNVAIIIDAIGWALSKRVSRRTFFGLTVLIILGFVVMTGAEASVVRAAIMASLLLLANQIGRMHNFRNALALTAVVMVVANPRILVWDLGFQLSFAALLGLTYLAPALRKLLRAKDEPGILDWRKNLFATLSAQLAVLPILLNSFGVISALCLITNILLLSAIPITMFFGFAVAFTAVLSGFLARILGWLAGILLAYELTIIDWFSRIGGAFTITNFSAEGGSSSGGNWFYGAIYWVVLVGFIFYVENKFPDQKA